MKSTNADKLNDARENFIRQWGAMGSSWGINRTMAQIHAFLMISAEPLDTNTIMEELQISRGNANTNLRDLVGWGLIRSYFVPGERKEFFEAEKDVWKMFCAISKERKRREIQPALEVLRDCADVTKGERSKEGVAFHTMMDDLADFVALADTAMDRISRSERSKVVPMILKALGAKKG
ncbi:hypothetical protein [Rubellicoccus peritrichatus]|uniref:HTH-type transcriptional regulator n=1 Tax=Rubellicoccus peritrichatus TaxID=3080537 RepID=A0AAQ3L8S8_9BACT|nr:hypothetical protein [Puniceicoccus sp. CR14]WOO40029.1 hypothetical protein RZN69_15505 [Puniceicoccus sp. CR14]